MKSQHAHRRLRNRSITRSAAYSITEMLESRLLFAAFDVTNTNDSGAGSLRQALTSANSTPGADEITFTVGTGQKTILLQNALPTITDPVTIDGSTQPGFAGKPLVAIIPSGPTSASALTISAGSSTVQDLVISEWGTGIELTGGAGNLVRGCYIGTDFTGALSASNNIGINIRNSSKNNLIGGTSKTARNVISGNSTNIEIQNSGTTGNIVRGNYIGVTAAGTASVNNGGSGTGVLVISADANIIGGSVAGAGNVISGNGSHAISLNNTNACFVQGNLIGTDATGKKGIGNGTGIDVNGDNNIVGGATALARNVITLGNEGITLGGDGNQVKGNYIGTDITGKLNLGNVFDGIIIAGNSNFIGGTVKGAGNIIAFNDTGNGGSGVVVSVGTKNKILGNSIFSNTNLGIDLGGNGVTPNDPSTVIGDSDNGPNGLQNFPILSSAASGASSTVVGVLESAVSTTFRLEFFASSAADPTGFGEGQNYLGAISVTTNASGEAKFTAKNLLASAAGSFITATATDSAGNTSEFSPAVPLSSVSLIGGVLNINGTSKGDVLALSVKSGKLSVTLNKSTKTFTNSSVKHINISLGDGNDTLTVGAGVIGVFCESGLGNDTLTGGNGNDSLTGGGGKDVLNGGAGNDRLSGLTSPDVINGGEGDDFIYGGDGDDVLDGGGGSDHIFGEAGNDAITGGSSNDQLYGGDGNDNMNGGKGADLVDGGAGTDTAAKDVLDTRVSIEKLV